VTYPIFSLKKQHEALQARVLASRAFILGPEVEAWEKEFGDFIGAKHSVGVSSGSDALLLALQTLGVGPGDEVIVPTYTLFASAGSVARLGARPVGKECVCEATSRGDSAENASWLLPFRCRPSHTFNQFEVRTPGAGKRDRLREALQTKNVGTKVYDPRPLHVQECFRDLGYREGDFPWAEEFSRETLALPIYPELETKELEQAASELARLVPTL